MIAQKAIMPHMAHPLRKVSMTAYLISLALAGLETAVARHLFAKFYSVAIAIEHEDGC
jgi:hypothetical protein